MNFDPATVEEMIERSEQFWNTSTTECQYVNAEMTHLLISELWKMVAVLAERLEER